MKHYSYRNRDHVETKKSFESYLDKINALFNDGTFLLVKMLSNYSENVLILYYLLENDRYLEEIMGTSIEVLLQDSSYADKLDNAYLRVGEYCVESGWPDRAKKMLGEALSINPGNERVSELLKSVLFKDQDV